MQDRERKMLGQEDGKITDAEIRNFHRQREGQQVGYRQVDETPDDLRRLVQNFAQFGELYRAAMACSMNPQIARNHLASLGITTIEDARRMLDTGVLKEVDDMRLTAINAARIAAEKNRERAEAKFAEHQAAMNASKEKPKKVSRQQADRKNLADKARQALHSTEKHADRFHVPRGQEKQFKDMVMGDPSLAIRTFGCSREDLVYEAKRLMPNIDTDMLRW